MPVSSICSRNPVNLGQIVSRFNEKFDTVLSKVIFLPIVTLQENSYHTGTFLSCNISMNINGRLYSKRTTLNVHVY